MIAFNTSIKLMVIVFIMFSGSMAIAATSTIEGTVQGLGCVKYAKVCPVSHNDPRSVDEKLFVVHLGGKDYRTVANLDRATMSNYLGRKVRVRGVIDDQDNTITARSLAVQESGAYKVVWSAHEKLYQHGQFFLDIGGGR